MKVRNRDGQECQISYDEIKHRIETLCTDEERKHLDIDKIVIQTINGIYDGITTSELDELSAGVCANLQSLHYLYDSLAGKILASNSHKNVRRLLAAAGFASCTFSNKIAYMEAANPGTFNTTFLSFVQRFASELDTTVDYGRDLLHNYFSIRTLQRAYLMQVKDQVVETAQDMWMRVAVAVHCKPPAGAADSAEVALALAKECYEAMSRGLYTHASPTLFNAGTAYEQMSSCYLLGTEDSIGGIFKTISDSAQISKWAGGIGVHVSNIRSKGSRITSTNGRSDGIIPMLKVYNETARYCNQSGKRKGSIAVYLEPWHADVWEFLELRQNTGAETERARDLFLALWVPDEFMARVRDGEDWYLMSPDRCPGLTDAVGEEFTRLYNSYVERGLYVRKLPARMLWQHVLKNLIETGTPYILFKDHVNCKTNHQNLGVIKSSNLCAEIAEYSDKDTYAVCNLASIAVSRFLKKDDTGSFRYDFDALHAVAKQVTVNLNRIIDQNMYPTPETRRSNMSTRPIGIGIQGLGDLYCMLKLGYEDEASMHLDAEIMETIYHGALEASVELAERDGAYECFAGSPFSRGVLQFDMGWPQHRVHHAPGRWDWDALKARVRVTGTRNSLLTALMPTASTSQILGNCECFEVFHANVFKRTTIAGEFMVINRYLMQDLMDIGMWSDAMRSQLLKSDGSVQNIPGIPDSLRRAYKTVWEVPQRSILDHATFRAPFVDQSQSMNLFFAQPNAQKLSSALLYGWAQGLKTGCYYLRSRPAVEAIKYSLLGASDGGALVSTSSRTGQKLDGQSSGTATTSEGTFCTRAEGCVMCSS